MKVTVAINVRNPEWYWEEKEAKGSMSRKEWEAFFGDKYKKHTTEFHFTFNFEVESYSDNRNGKFDLEVYTLKTENQKQAIKHLIPVENVTIVEFTGINNEKSQVIVSNELIHQFISARKNGNGKLYWYFYLKPGTDAKMVTKNVWIQNEKLEEIRNQNDNNTLFQQDPEIKLTKFLKANVDLPFIQNNFQNKH